jgi:chromosome segregation ATPase
MSAVLQHSADVLPIDPEGAPDRSGAQPKTSEMDGIIGSEMMRSLEDSVKSMVEKEVAGSALALSLPHIATNASDWNTTLSMVERAAATIRTYEKRYVQLEKQSRSLADRAAEDHHRMQTHLRSLEERLKQAEARAIKAETAARDAEYEEWEAETRAKKAEQRAAEAEARATQAEAYLRRVHELLSGV